jgi:hypothetical protein
MHGPGGHPILVLTPYRRHCVLESEDFTGFIQSGELMMFLKFEMNCTARKVAPS